MYHRAANQNTVKSSGRNIKDGWQIPHMLSVILKVSQIAIHKLLIVHHNISPFLRHRVAGVFRLKDIIVKMGPMLDHIHVVLQGEGNICKINCKIKMSS
ncbi:hypothetical protein D3C71_1980020 [compost metagenome]